MDDSALIVAQVALEAGLDLDLDQCQAIGTRIGDEPIDAASVTAAAESLGYPVPAAA